MRIFQGRRPCLEFRTNNFKISIYTSKSIIVRIFQGPGRDWGRGPGGRGRQLGGRALQGGLRQGVGHGASGLQPGKKPSSFRINFAYIKDKVRRLKKVVFSDCDEEISKKTFPDHFTKITIFLRRKKLWWWLADFKGYIQYIALFALLFSKWLEYIPCSNLWYTSLNSHKNKKWLFIKEFFKGRRRARPHPEGEAEGGPGQIFRNRGADVRRREQRVIIEF